MSTHIKAVARPTAEDIFANTSDKQLWPGVTMKDVMNYYISVAKYIIPHLRDKVQNLQRNATAHEGQPVEAINPDHAPWADWIETVKIYSPDAKDIPDYILPNNIEALLYLNTIGTIEMHPWLSRYYIVDRPDSMVFDLVSSEKNSIEEVVTVANTLNAVLDSTGTKSYVKTSGAAGLHVYVPVNGQYEYDKVRRVAQVIAERVVDQLPALATSERKASIRSKEKVYIDYTHNKRGATLPAVYSVRVAQEPYVSMPLRWEEVNPGLHPEFFTIHNALIRMEIMGNDLFYPVLTDRTELNKVLNILN
jgi:bifunctional non-homologous end joining protein LigD